MQKRKKGEGLTACLLRVGDHAGMTDKLNPAPWVNMQEWHLHRAGEHPGTVGEHNQEWWVNMLRNLQGARSSF